MSRLQLYKAKYKRWNADTGSIEWHEATAEIRAYCGNSLSAAIHSFVATCKSLVKVFDKFIKKIQRAKPKQSKSNFGVTNP